MADNKVTPNKIDEGSLAGDTMHPNTRPAGNDPKSKFEALTHMIGAMHTMRKEDWVKCYTQMMDSIGKEGKGVGDVSSKNKNSINAKPSGAVGHGGPSTSDPMPKLSVKEDVEEMFNGEDLSEEFKEKAVTLFEAAVTARYMLEQERLNEEFQTKLAEEIENVTNQLTEDLTDKVDTYVNYVVENWMEENQVAIESSLRAELMGDFLEGLKTLFTEHYIDIPTEKVNVVEALQAKVSELEDRLNGTISENASLKEAVVKGDKKDVLENFTADLALSEREKFERLAEGLEFDGDLDNYATKLSVIKETYFKKHTPKETNLNEETFEELEKIYSDPIMEKYAQAISKTIKR